MICRIFPVLWVLCSSLVAGWAQPSFGADPVSLLVPQFLPLPTYSSLATSPDGRFVAISMMSNKNVGPLVIWDIRASRVVKRLDAVGAGLTSRFSGTGRTLVVGQNNLVLVDTKTWTVRETLPKFQLLDACPANDWVLASAYGGLCLISADTGKVLFRRNGESAPFLGAFSPDGLYMAVSGAIGDVTIYSTKDNQLVGTFAATPSKLDGAPVMRFLKALCFTGDSKRLLCMTSLPGSSRHEIRVIDLSGKLIGEYLAEKDFSIGSAVRMDNGDLLTFPEIHSPHQTAYLWKEGKAVPLPFLPFSYFSAPVPGGKVAFEGMMSQRGVGLADLNEGRVVNTLSAPAEVKGLFLSGDGATLTSIHEGGNGMDIVTWDAASMRAVRKRRVDKGSIAVSRDGTVAAVYGSGLKVFDLVNDGVILELTGKFVTCEFSPDGSTVFLAGASTQLGRVPLATGKPIMWAKAGDTSAPTAKYKFSPDGKWVMAELNFEATLIETATGEAKWTVETFKGWPGADFVWSPDGKRVAVLTRGSRMQVRDAETGSVSFDAAVKMNAPIGMNWAEDGSVIWAAAYNQLVKFDIAAQTSTVLSEGGELMSMATLGRDIYTGVAGIDRWRDGRMISSTFLLPDAGTRNGTAEWVTWFGDTPVEASPNAEKTGWLKRVSIAEMGYSDQELQKIAAGLGK